MIFAKKSKYDRLIVGLGNIGLKYDGTRHNVGFACVDAVADKQLASFKPWKKSLVADCKIAEERCLLAKPTTYMNLSGEAVKELTDYYGIPLDRVIVISDDIELAPGRLRIRKSGGHGGQNGLRNIISLCGDGFARIRIGTGSKPNPEYDLAAWVLSKYTGEDGEAVRLGISNAAEAVSAIIEKGIDKAMTEFNGRAAK